VEVPVERHFIRLGFLSDRFHPDRPDTVAIKQV
jgi:hypothetical protein